MIADDRLMPPKLDSELGNMQVSKATPVLLAEANTSPFEPGTGHFKGAVAGLRRVGPFFASFLNPLVLEVQAILFLFGSSESGTMERFQAF